MSTVRKKNISLQKGFSLVELLVVFAVMSMLTVGGVVSFSSYGRSQSFKTSVDDVQNELQLARSRALSRVKPTQCGLQPILAYQVSLSGQIYRILAVCNGTTYVIKSKSLPSNVSFAAGTVLVNFATSTGTVTPSPITIVITGNGATKSIIVNGTGVISVQ